jgi:hypothetical protein
MMKETTGTANNEKFTMTRRYPDLPRKKLISDSKICGRLVAAWDVAHDQNKVFDIWRKENKNLSNERYWELLRTVWVLCGSTARVPEFLTWFNSKRTMRHFFSTPEEHKRLREMPVFLTVYRAANEEIDGGIAWTLNLKYAEYYQEAYQKKQIYTRQIAKPEVFALIERNNEEEVLILHPPTPLR